MLQENVKTVMEQLRAVERIVMLEIQIPVLLLPRKIDFPLEKVANMVREYRDLFKSKLT